MKFKKEINKVESYIFNPYSIRYSSNGETQLILEGIIEICQALSIISNQLYERNQNQQREKDGFKRKIKMKKVVTQEDDK